MKIIVTYFFISMLFLAQVESFSQYKFDQVPKELGLDKFYMQYVNVNGIHMISSHKVSEEAIYAACKTIDFMTSSLPENVLDSMVAVGTKVAIMGRYEGTTDIPEHAHLANDTTLNWDLRARGLGGTVEEPLTSCAEENLLCYQIDKYHAEDILIHEFARSIHLIGIKLTDSLFDEKLEVLFNKALDAGKYKDVYAATNIEEYWAEGIQNWFNVNAEVAEPDGKHDWVNTREDMLKYNPDLYDLISNYFDDFEENPSCHTIENLYQEE